MKSKVFTVKCKCENEYQDKKYGKGNRVVTEIKATSKYNGKYRCTVCGTIHK